MLHSNRTRITALAGLLLGLQGCSDQSSAPVAPTPNNGALSRSALQTNAAVDLVARGIAYALADPALRLQVLEDMRDSPFPGNSLHLRSYLQGTRGWAISAAAARSLGIPTEAFLSRIHSLPDLAFSVSSRLDRIEWTGSSDIVVTASTTTREQRRSLTSLPGYTVNGNPVTIPHDHKIRQTVLSMLSPEFSFGTDPEAVRAAAPTRKRKTISIAEEGTEPCDPLTAEIECEAETGSIGWTFGPTLALGSDCLHDSAREVTMENDVDRDGLKDDCERRFASSFQPELVRHFNEVYFGREPYWTVQLANNLVTIGYLLSYYYDGGANGFTEHHGDSEFIIVRIVNHYGIDTWRVSSVTTSAHWGVCCGWDETRDTQGGGFQYTGARPYVYAAKHKHANYESETRCDERFGDECSPIRSYNTEAVGFWSDRNIGNSQYPYTLMPGTPGGPDCTYSKVSYADHPGIECFLSTSLSSSFAGWSNRSSSAYHYSTALRYYGLY